MIQKLFTNLLLQYTNNIPEIEHFWHELVTHYNGKKRYYHNLNHIEHLYITLLAYYNSKIPNEVLFALLYHDAIYNIHQNDNELQSAVLARKVMAHFKIDESDIKLVEQIILSTQSHTESSNTNINAFLDADLSILGSSERDYFEYTKNIRKEYSFYPDLLYKPGRRKVIEHFLAMPRIYKTNWFHNLYEKQARINLQHELQQLS